MGISNWWGRMKATYGESENPFQQGMMDGKSIATEVKTKNFARNLEKKRLRKLEKQKKKRRKI